MLTKPQVDCEDEQDIQCGCLNEVWMNSDCSTAFLCQGEMSETGENPGNTLSCFLDDYIVSADFHYPVVKTCVPDVGQCPGSFHFG